MDTTPSFLKRCAENPILSAADIPYDASLIFNAGVTKYNGKYVMAFRNDYGSKEEQWRECVAKKKDRMPPLKTSIGLALSDDGIHWTPGPKPVFVLESDEIFRSGGLYVWKHHIFPEAVRHLSFSLEDDKELLASHTHSCILA